MILRRLFLSLAWLTFSSSLLPAQAPKAQPKLVRSFLEEHCFACHDSNVKKSDLDLSAVRFDLDSEKGMALWVRIHDRVGKGEMPPGKRTARVPESDKASFLESLSKELTTAHLARKGRVLRRLNRVEYENTLQDLLGIRAELKQILPEDGQAHGFDNVGEALDLSEIHLRRYLQAADKAMDEAIAKQQKPEKKAKDFTFAEGRRAKSFIGRLWLKRPDGAVVFFSSGSYPPKNLESFRAWADGIYQIQVTGYGYQTPDPIPFALYSGSFGRNPDSRLHGHFSVPPTKPTTVDLKIYLRRNDTLRINPYGISGGGELRKKGPKAYKGPGMAIQKVKVEGPFIEQWPGKGHRLLFGNLAVKEIEPANPRIKKRSNYQPKFKIVANDPVGDAEKLLRGFLPVAFRRPVADHKIPPYLQLIKSQLAKGDGFEQAMRTGYAAVLCSPNFLYLQERPGKLDDYALANRLSYFLWSSMPDTELMDLADKKKLSDPKVLRQQTERMLQDPKAQRFTKNFVGQWLNLREIDFTVPDKQLYPEFDTMLEEAMVRETEDFFNEILHNNLSILNFLDSDWTVLNERLAIHYGIEGVKGTEYRKVKLPADSHRGGVLAHASVLRVSANGTTTSPVVRGAWVLDRILGTPPPPPPPGIPGVEPDIRGATTLREQLAKHRTLQTCASCHKEIDPPGFALENYDVIGGWRENYRSKGKDFPFPKVRTFQGRRISYRIGPKVDASGETADNQKFSDIEDFKKILLDKKDQFTRNLAERVATYSTGRGMGFSDRPIIEEIVQQVKIKNYGFRELIHEVIQSELFQNK